MEFKSMTTSNEAKFNDIYKQSFPAAQRFDIEKLKELSDHDSSINIDCIISENEIIGISIHTSVNKNKGFIMYLAIDTKYRSKGYGAGALSLLKKQYPDGFILEAELTGENADNELQRVNRYRFYRKNNLIDSGFVAKNKSGDFHLLKSDALVTIEDYFSGLTHFNLNSTVTLL